MGLIPKIVYGAPPLVGDLVSMTTLTNGGGYCTITGVVIGKLTKESATYVAPFESKTEDIFVVLPSENDAESAYDHFWQMMPSSDVQKSIKLAEGTYEPKSLVMGASQLVQFYSSAMSEEFVKQGRCPRCGDSGYWKMLALNCHRHGMFL
jgi:hypothetical protein